MENNSNREYTDASWEHVSRDGHGYEAIGIKFRNNHKSNKVKGFLKGVAFMLVAAVSGGATAAYMVNNKYSKLSLSYGPNNPSMLEQNKTNTPTADIPKNAITKVAETVGPTVVGISNRIETFFGEKSNGSGSGIIFDGRGYIVTNYHVIQGAESVTVKLANSDKIFKAKFVGAEPSRDIAVIKIDAENLPVAKFGDSSKVKTGDIAIAIGNPLGDEFAGSVTAGIISGVNRSFTMSDDRTGKTTRYTVLQTDAAINPGNSGGALCNEAGEIIGINSLKVDTQYDTEGMGFAITINEANTIVKRIMGTGSKPEDKQSSDSVPVLLGVTVRDAVPEEDNGVKGAYIEDVTPGLGAATAGLKPTDIIVEVDKTKIQNRDDLVEVLKKHKSGDSVSVKVWRNGRVLQSRVNLSENKSQ